MRVFNDRSKPSFFYFPGSGQIPLTAPNVDPATGYPTVPFSIKLADGALAADSSTTGSWYVTYQATAKLGVTVTSGNGTVVSSHTFSAGSGSFQFSFTSGGNGILLNFDRGVTDFHVYDPTTSAAAIGGSTPGLWYAPYLRTLTPYKYIRFMDAANTNSDYLAGTGTWPTVVNWADRSTPTNYKTNYIDGLNRGLPIEWMVDLCNQKGKSAWFNISELASDDCITQFATYVAQNLSAGSWATFELGNERWNTGVAFYTYRKAGVAGMTEALAAQPALSVAPASLTSFSSDGTTATVVFAASHGQLTGLTTQLFGLQPGYTGFAPTGTITVVDTKTLTYPCTQPSTGGIVAPATVLGSTGSISTAQSAYSLRMRSVCVVSYSSDGVAPGFPGATATATVVFNQAHGATTGQKPFLQSAATGFTGFYPVANATLTVVDAVTVSYPCTQAFTSTPVVASKVHLTASYCISLNFASTLFAGQALGGAVLSVFDFNVYWHYRRVWQMAKLVRDAFSAAGRPAQDCKPLLALQAGTAFKFGVQYIVPFLNGIMNSSTVKLSDRLSALSIGGYLGLGQGVMNSGFASQLIGGVIKTRTDPSLITEAAVAAQMQEQADRAYGCYSYQCFNAYAQDQGVEVWGYEVGNDITTFSSDPVAQTTAKVGYQTDYATYGVQQELMYTAWLRNFQQLGFTKVGWYQAGAGTLSGTGTFNLGQTQAEIDYTTPSISQGPKFRAILNATTNPKTYVTRHAFPCTIDGRDVVGNEAFVTTANVYFSLGGTNNTFYSAGYIGPLLNGMSYFVWSEISQTVTVTITGDNTNAATRPISVKRLGGTEGLFTVAGSQSNKVIGTTHITLLPGPNYVFVSCTLGASAATSVFMRSIQFS